MKTALAATVVHVWDLLTGEVRRLTQTMVDESLNAVSVTPEGLVRTVWTVDQGMGEGYDIEGSALQRPSAFRVTVQQPIDADGSSTFSAKRGVVPVKFANGACELPPATIRVTRLGGAGDQPVDESLYASKADSGSAFRIADCAYQYHLAASALGAGRYRVEALVNGAGAGAAELTLR